MSIGFEAGKDPCSVTVPVMEPVVLESTTADATSDWVVCRLSQPAEARTMPATAMTPLIDEWNIRTSGFRNWEWKQRL